MKQEETLKERIIAEMVIPKKNMEAWRLAREIYSSELSRLKTGVTLGIIYDRILEMQREEGRKERKTKKGKGGFE